MKRFILIITSIISIIGISYAANLIEYGKYQCKYYMYGKDNNCTILVKESGLKSNCDFLDKKTMSTLIKSSKCFFIPAKREAVYECKYTNNTCRVIIRGEFSYSADCLGDKQDIAKAVKDTKDGKCTMIEDD